ncbi:MAG: hypothetical protein HY327_12510 [Chloroflexi bacterium]|nr:hypothetical protein [Chloroflexota bacterium]
MLNPISRRVLLGFFSTIAFLFFGMSAPVAAQDCGRNPLTGLPIPCPQPQPPPPQQPPGQQPPVEGPAQLPQPKIGEITTPTNTPEIAPPIKAIFINEVGCNPKNMDQNKDGKVNADDKFIELYNASEIAVELGGWSMYISLEAQIASLNKTLEALKSQGPFPDGKVPQGPPQAETFQAWQKQQYGIQTQISELQAKQTQTAVALANRASADSANGKFSLPKGTMIEPMGFLVLFQGTHHFNCPPEGGKVQLFYPNGMVADEVVYPMLMPDQSYARAMDGGMWAMDCAPSPMMTNANKCMPQDTGFLVPAVQTPIQPVLLLGLGILGLLAAAGIIIVGGKGWLKFNPQHDKPSVEGVPIGYQPQADAPKDIYGFNPQPEPPKWLAKLKELLHL